MAQTDLRKYGTEERLGKMDLDLIDVTVDLNGDGAYADNSLLFVVTPIPYAVSVPGGTGLIHSITAIVDTDDGADTGNMDIVITSNGTALTNAIRTDINTSTNTFAVKSATCGIANITNLADLGTLISIGNASNIGIVAKAEADSTSLYCYGIARSTNTYGGNLKLTLRFGIIKD